MLSRKRNIYNTLSPPKAERSKQNRRQSIAVTHCHSTVDGVGGLGEKWVELRSIYEYIFTTLSKVSGKLISSGDKLWRGGCTVGYLLHQFLYYTNGILLLIPWEENLEEARTTMTIQMADSVTDERGKWILRHRGNKKRSLLLSLLIKWRCTIQHSSPTNWIRAVRLGRPALDRGGQTHPSLTMPHIMKKELPQEEILRSLLNLKQVNFSSQFILLWSEDSNWSHLKELFWLWY